MRSICRQVFNAVLGALVLAAALLGACAPASAHDAAESSSPAPGATVPAAPREVSVTLNKNPMALGARFSVRDSAGAEWADGSVEIVDNVASQRLKDGAPAGAYTVAWRLVSSDSHPIEGTFGFTVAPAAGASPSPAPTGAGATAAPGAPAMGTALPGTTASPEPEADASEPFPWSLVIFAAVMAGLLVAIGLMARRRLADSDGSGRPS